MGAIPDLIEDGYNGWLVEPGDVQALAIAMSKLLDDPETSRLFGERSYQMTQERYSWETVGKRFQQNILNSLETVQKVKAEE